MEKYLAVVACVALGLAYLVGYERGASATDRAYAKQRAVAERLAKERAKQDGEEYAKVWSESRDRGLEIEGASRTIALLSDRLRNALASADDHSATASVERLRADNTVLRRLLSESTRLLEECTGRLGRCADAHDTCSAAYEKMTRQ